MVRANRRLAAIVAADVAGYSRLVGLDEEGTLSALRSHRTELVDPLLEEHGGRVANTAGDSLLIEFQSAVDAVRFAVSMQAGMDERTADLSEDRRIAFRIGINVGDVVEQYGDLLGDGVNVAARLEGLAEPGGVCLSRSARDQVRDRLDLELEDLGEIEVKNITRPVRVFRVVVGSQLEARMQPPASAPTPVAATATWRLPKVLLAPFRHLGSDGAVEALAAGVTETLAAALARFEEFELIDPGTVEAISERGSQEAGKQLGATYVVEGSVQLASGKARIGVQLIDARSGERVWSETLDKDSDDVFSLQDDISAFVASTLGEAVGEEQARAIA